MTSLAGASGQAADLPISDSYVLVVGGIPVATYMVTGIRCVVIGEETVMGRLDLVGLERVLRGARAGARPVLGLMFGGLRVGRSRRRFGTVGRVLRSGAGFQPQDERAQVELSDLPGPQLGLPRHEWLVAGHLLDGVARERSGFMGMSRLQQALGGHDLQRGVVAAGELQVSTPRAVLPPVARECVPLIVGPLGDLAEHEPDHEGR